MSDDDLRPVETERRWVPIRRQGGVNPAHDDGQWITLPRVDLSGIESAIRALDARLAERRAMA